MRVVTLSSRVQPIMQLSSPCLPRLASCAAGDTRAQLLPSLARAGHGGWGRGLIRRLAPPSHIWPASFDQHRRCGLDPYYSGCGNVK